MSRAALMRILWIPTLLVVFGNWGTRSGETVELTPAQIERALDLIEVELELLDDLAREGSHVSVDLYEDKKMRKGGKAIGKLVKHWREQKSKFLKLKAALEQLKLHNLGLGGGGGRGPKGPSRGGFMTVKGVGVLVAIELTIVATELSIEYRHEVFSFADDPNFEYVNEVEESLVTLNIFSGGYWQGFGSYYSGYLPWNWGD